MNRTAPAHEHNAVCCDQPDRYLNQGQVAKDVAGDRLHQAIRREEEYVDVLRLAVEVLRCPLHFGLDLREFNGREVAEVVGEAKHGRLGQLNVVGTDFSVLADSFRDCSAKDAAELDDLVAYLAGLHHFQQLVIVFKIELPFAPGRTLRLRCYCVAELEYAFVCEALSLNLLAYSAPSHISTIYFRGDIWHRVHEVFQFLHGCDGYDCGFLITWLFDFCYHANEAALSWKEFDSLVSRFY